MAVDWGYYDKFDELTDKYLPMRGEGDTKATQIVTAVCKLVYKWYNDGDVFDNSYVMEGWANDLSDYANWLWEHTEVSGILDGIKYCYTNDDYENLLKAMADKLMDAEYLAEQNKMGKVGSVYDCNGKFRFIEFNEEDEEYYY